MSRSSPSVRAPARVAIHSTSRGGKDPRLPAHCLKHGSQAHLLEHVEAVVARRAVAPSDTVIREPAFSGTGEMPDPSFRFESRGNA
jgi:hypothetical protein